MSHIKPYSLAVNTFKHQENVYFIGYPQF